MRKLPGWLLLRISLHALPSTDRFRVNVDPQRQIQGFNLPLPDYRNEAGADSRRGADLDMGRCGCNCFVFLFPDREHREVGRHKAADAKTGG